LSITYRYFDGLPVGIEADGGLGNWFNGLPAQALLAASAQTLTPGLFSDTDTFYTPTLAGQSVLVPALATDTDTFYQPTATPGAVTLTPSLFNDSDTYYAPIINVADYPLTPALFADTDTFFAPTVKFDQFLTASLYTDSDSFYAPTVDSRTTLTPSLFSDTDTFLAPSATPGTPTRSMRRARPRITRSRPASSPTLTASSPPRYQRRGAMLPGLVDESAVIYPAHCHQRARLHRARHRCRQHPPARGPQRQRAAPEPVR
jgi:hypothetical protein